MEISVSRLIFLALCTELWLPGNVPVWGTGANIFQVHGHSQIKSDQAIVRMCVLGVGLVGKIKKQSPLKLNVRRCVESRGHDTPGSRE